MSFKLNHWIPCVITFSWQNCHLPIWTPSRQLQSEFPWSPIDAIYYLLFFPVFLFSYLILDVPHKPESLANHLNLLLSILSPFPFILLFFLSTFWSRPQDAIMFPNFGCAQAICHIGPVWLHTIFLIFSLFTPGLLPISHFPSWIRQKSWLFHLTNTWLISSHNNRIARRAFILFTFCFRLTTYHHCIVFCFYWWNWLNIWSCFLFFHFPTLLSPL